MERSLWEGSYDTAFRLKVQGFYQFEDAIAINPLLSLCRCGNICYERGITDGQPRVKLQDQQREQLKGKASLTMFLMEQAKKAEEEKMERKNKDKEKRKEKKLHSSETRGGFNPKKLRSLQEGGGAGGGGNQRSTKEIISDADQRVVIIDYSFFETG